jgi:predicted acylesterase/phospholipase RssA/CRP-like cAMP-binding protein
MDLTDSQSIPDESTGSSKATKINYLEMFSQYGLDDQLERVHLSEGQTIFEQGEVGDSMYVLKQGHLGVRMLNSQGDEMDIGEETESGTSVGEMSLVTGQVRLASVYARSEVELVRIDKVAFDRLVEAHPGLLVDLAETTAPRLQRVQLARVLMDLLGEIDLTTLQTLQAELEWRQLSHGEVLIHQGDPGDAMYIVINGGLRVSAILPDGTERVVDESGPGDVVGEFALLTGAARSASICAIRETNVVKLTPPVFTSLIERYPHAMMQIARIIIDRHKRSLRLSHARRVRASNLALIPASQDVQLTEFAHQLADCLTEFGSVLHLNSNRLDHIYGKEGAAQTPLDHPTNPVLSSWMSGQETQYQYILFEADPIWSTWTRRCVRQADRLLIVGQANSDPSPGQIETGIQSLGIAARTELVLLHLTNTIRPNGTSAWLNPRKVNSHHHVRINDRAHYKRLAHRLAGRTTGLVLSGGAARGFAHVGVLRALEELGIQIDRVGGTSMGALIGAGYAMGLSYKDMASLAQRFANPKQLFDYTLPFTSLMTSKKMTSVLNELYEGLYIEDLWRPFFCVSSNLTRAEPVVHQTGLLWKSVRASVAIPGIFTPILHQGEVLVDGGTLNNFPVDIMDELCEGGTVIGVNVSQSHETEEDYQFGPSISGWQILWSRVNPFSEPIHAPALATNLMRSLELSSVHQIKTSETLADILIQPEVKGYAMLDFGSYESIIEIGYQAALKQLAQSNPAS